METESTTTRLARGRATLAAIDGQAGETVVTPLGDLGRYVVEFAYGDIYSRDGLSLRDRELATVAVLTALGGREPQLRWHLGAALNVGLTAAEVEEIILQTVPYAGFPTAINALNLHREVVADRPSPEPERDGDRDPSDRSVRSG